MEKEKLHIMKEVEKGLLIPNEKNKDKRLFMFFGIPGSGKSLLARELCERYPSVYLSSDAISIAYNLESSDRYYWTFEILNELIRKYLQKGYSVIADSNSDKVSVRKELYDIAEETGATPEVFWLKTDITLSEKRQKQHTEKMEQEFRNDHLYAVTARELKTYLRDIEPPEDWEKVTIIDGGSDLTGQILKWEES